MLSENADFKALSVKEIHAASDGTRKVELSFSILYIFCIFSPSSDTCNLRGYLMIFKVLANWLCIACLYLVSFLESLLVDCLNSQDIADFIHIGWWDGHRNSCHTLWYRQDYCVCFQSSWMCYELSILLYWKARLVLSIMIDSCGYTVFTFAASFSCNVILQNGSQETSYCRRNCWAGRFCQKAIHKWNRFHHQCCIYGRSTIALGIRKLIACQVLLYSQQIRYHFCL